MTLLSIPSVGSLIAQQLSQLTQLAEQYVDELILPAQLLCGLFAFIYVGAKLWSTWARGERIDFYPLLRPFAVGLVVVCFPTFVSLLDVVVYPLELAMDSLLESAQPDFYTQQAAYLQVAEQVRDAVAVFERNHLDHETLITAEHTATESFQHCVAIAARMSQLLLSGVSYFLQIYVQLAKLVLLLIGPFAFALSLLPGFQQNIQQWVARYWHVALLLPFVTLVSFMVSLLFTGCVFPTLIELLSPYTNEGYTFADYQQAMHAQTMVHLLWLLFHLLSAALYALAPAFATWIVRPDGTTPWNRLVTKTA